MLYRNKAIILLTVLFFAVSCTTPRVVVKTEYRDRWRTDTVQQVDSFYQYRYIREKGDTVYIHDSIDRWRWKERVVKEYIHDSIDRPVEVVKPRTKFEQAAYSSGYVLWGLLIVGAIIGIIKLLRKFHVI